MDAGAPCDGTFVSPWATTIGSSRLFLGWPERKLPFDFPSFFGAHFLRISFLSVNSIKNFKTHFWHTKSYVSENKGGVFNNVQKINCHRGSWYPVLNATPWTADVCRFQFSSFHFHCTSTNSTKHHFHCFVTISVKAAWWVWDSRWQVSEIVRRVQSTQRAKELPGWPG